MKQKGFTLIELLVVLTIIAVLTGLFIPGWHWAMESAKRAETAVLLEDLRIGLLHYEDEYGDWPAILYKYVKDEGGDIDISAEEEGALGELYRTLSGYTNSETGYVAEGTTNNIRGIVFVSVPSKFLALEKDGVIEGNVSESENVELIIDSWGRPLHAVLDSGDGKIDAIDKQGTSGDARKEVVSRAGLWSMGGNTNRLKSYVTKW